MSPTIGTRSTRVASELTAKKGRGSERPIGYNQRVDGHAPATSILVSSGPGVLEAVDRDAFRQLPPVNAVLEHELLVPSLHARGRVAVLDCGPGGDREARSALRRERSGLADPASLANRSREILEARRPSLRPVINATGILLHTGLGRAPLAEEAIAAVAEVARGYCNLELDLEEGARGRRTGGNRAAPRGTDRCRGGDGREQQRRRPRCSPSRPWPPGERSSSRVVSSSRSAAVSGSRKSSRPRGPFFARWARPTRPGWLITSERSVPRRPRSCGSIAAISASSALPRMPVSTSSRNSPTPGTCG